MTTYSKEEIREGRKKIDQVCELLNDAAWRLCVHECATEAQQKTIDEAVEKIRLLAWDIVFPRPTFQQTYENVRHIWTAKH
jgi:polysaccharide pyruvyl transferase WcaK-like protein